MGMVADTSIIMYKVARDGVEIGEHSSPALLQLYYDQKIKLTDHLWREGLEDWMTLYDLYTEFLSTPDQLRAYDREAQMITNTSYRIKYLINKSRARIKRITKAPAKNERILAQLEAEAIKIREKIAKAEDIEEEHDLRSDLLVIETEIEIFPSMGDGRIDDDYAETESVEAKEEIEQLQNMRREFWCTTFEQEQPKLNKKDLKRLAESYETRVSQILRGAVPSSFLYFVNGSPFYLLSSRALWDSHGKNLKKPTDKEIKDILKVLDDRDPEWDNTNPGLFYSELGAGKI